MDNTEFGKRLRELRKSKGFTQQALAEKAGIDEKHLCRIEKGKYFPSYATLSKLFSVLCITIEEAGLKLEHLEINRNPIYAKALHVLNSAKNDDELLCYLDALKSTQRALRLHK